MQEKTFFQKIIKLLLLFIGFNLVGSFVTLLLLDLLFNIDAATVLSMISNVEQLDSSSINALKFMQMIQVFFSFIVPAHLFARSEAKNEISAYFKFNNTKSLHYVLGLVLIIAVSPLVAYLAEINQSITFPSALSSVENYFRQQQLQNEKLTAIFLKNNTGADLFINIFIIGILAAMAEELFFRGVLQKIFIDKVKNIHWAILACAVLFSALHQEFYSLIPRILLGLLLGYAFVYANSIWVPILIHFTNNTLAVVLDSLYKQGLSSINPNENEYFGIIGVLISLILSILLFWYWNKNKSMNITYNGERVD